MNHRQDNIPPDLEALASRLEQERPQLSALELDSVKRRVISSASGNRHGGNFMKSRLALISMVAMGLLMSGTGATLAVDGLNASQSAGVAQYGSGDEGAGGGVLGETETADDKGPSAGRGDVAGGGGGGDSAPGAAQPTRQIEQGAQAQAGGELPFTGYAGIGVLLGGLALLSAGLVLRRTARQQ